jgi:hypothetical protein
MWLRGQFGCGKWSKSCNLPGSRDMYHNLSWLRILVALFRDLETLDTIYEAYIITQLAPKPHKL